MESSAAARHGEGLGIGERLEQPALLRFQGENRQEGHGDDEQAEEQRRTDLDGSLDQYLAAGLAGRRALQMLVRVLDHDDGGIHHRADGDGDAAEAHDVGAEAQRPHADIGNEDAERQRDDRHQRAAGMKQKDHADQGDDRALLDQRALEVIDRPVDQVGAVIDRLDGDALGQARRQLGKPALHVVDHRKRILAEALQHDAGDGLTFTVHLGDAAALVGGQLDPGHVLQQHRDAAFVLDHDLLDVGQALEIAASAHGELGLRHFHRAAADIHVAVADRVADARQRNVERLEPARIDHHAVLLDEAADAGDLRYARGIGTARTAHTSPGWCAVRRGCVARRAPHIGRPSLRRWRRDRGSA